MNLRSALAGATGVAFMVACSGAHKLGDGNQSSEGSGGDAQGSGGQANQGGQGGDPSVGGDPGSYAAAPSYAGGSYGGNLGLDGGQVSYGGGSYGGDPGSFGGTSYGGVAGAGNYGAGAYPAGAFGFGGSVGGAIGAGGQVSPNTGGYPPQSTPGIDVTGGAGAAGVDGGVPSNPLTGSWSGYVENYRFESGSDALLLTLSQQIANELSGHIIFGQSSGPLHTATEVVGPGVSLGGEHLWEPLEGFAYTAMNGRVDGSRLMFDVAPGEAWSSVCSAQVQTPGKNSCESPYWSFDSVSRCWADVNGVSETADCGLMCVCAYVCKCDEAHCFADTGTALIHVDVALRQPYLDGSVAELGNSVLNVHFSPQ